MVAKGRIAAAAQIDQSYLPGVASVQLSISNTWFLGQTHVTLPRASPPKRQLDRFSRFCRAHSRDQQTDRHRNHVTSRQLYNKTRK